MEENIVFRKAVPEDSDGIWKILQQAIARRKTQGSTQWQDGYPNPCTLAQDIENNNGYIVESNGVLVGYVAVIFSSEPAYEEIVGNWLTHGEYGVVHRLAVSDLAAGRGVATIIMKQAEDICRLNHVKTVRVDTNFDNAAMLRIFKNLGYVYCGKVYYRGNERMAFEKILA